MPDTAEHRADMFQLAADRRKAGKPIWDRKIRLADVFHAGHLTFERRRDLIAARLRASAWLTGRDEFDDLVLLVDDLAEAEDADEFDAVWDAIYDAADEDRVWIETR
jgi:hypothetical protein